MCYKQPNHVTFFRPYRDTHGIERVFTCTIWDTNTNKLAKGCTILSLDDEFNREIGKQLSYNKASRALNNRYTHPIVTHKAWEAIQALDPSEMRDFFREYGSRWVEDDGSLLSGFICASDDLTPTDMIFFTKRGYRIPNPEDARNIIFEDKLDRMVKDRTKNELIQLYYKFVRMPENTVVCVNDLKYAINLAIERMKD